jgi:asparagine synthase (glutamine-hydrolysing)
MCGICGFVNTTSTTIPPQTIYHMSHTLHHRGPDSDGYFQDDFVTLGMKRLSIIDLHTGQQPITNEDGRLQLIFNGEIFNYRTLRRQLTQMGHQFRTQSDSEIIVHAYESYGRNCVTHFNGQFAFAIWDRQERTLLLARDRLGINPLYYWHDDAQFVFASELKALRQHPLVPCQLNPIALDHLLTLEYIPAPLTILQNIHKLPPAHTLFFENGKICLEKYWDIHPHPVNSSFAQASDQLNDLLDDAVKIRLQSDVPLGVFLSGGIDSSAIVASMHRSVMGQEPIQTFAIGFAEASYNELPFAQQVADLFDTQHTTQTLSPDLLSLVEKLATHLDEPLADFSIFPTYLVSCLASESVKVVLSGDGGDELFAGYDTYVAQWLARGYGKLPAFLTTSLLPSLTQKLPPQPAKKGVINKIKRFVEGAALPPHLQHTRWMQFLSASDKTALYTPDFQHAIQNYSTTDTLTHHFQHAPFDSPLAQQQYVDIHTYLAHNILTKVDRMSMAASVETRVPFLDHRLVEFALNLPASYKLKHGKTKHILRHALRHRLPSNILNRPKQGFSIPLKHWLRTTLRPLLHDTLTSQSFHQLGYFQPQTINRWLAEHQAQRANHSHRLWALLIFALWHQNLKCVTHRA